MPTGNGKQNLVNLAHEVAARQSIRRSVGHATTELTHDELETLLNAAFLHAFTQGEAENVVPLRKNAYPPGGRM
jgi:transcriptional regulator of met regulon